MIYNENSEPNGSSTPARLTSHATRDIQWPHSFSQKSAGSLDITRQVASVWTRINWTRAIHCAWTVESI